MSRYIDAIDRGRLIRDILNEYGDTGGTEDANKIYRMILNQPTADVRENVKGEWIKLDEEPVYFAIIECSECGDKLFNIIGQPLPKFCSNCGADMRGENNG